MKTLDVIKKRKQKKKYLDEVYEAFIRGCACDDDKTGKLKEMSDKCIVDFYQGLVKLPYPFQHQEAGRLFSWISGLAKKIPSLLVFEDGSTEKTAYDYIKTVSEEKPDFALEFRERKKKIEAEKKEIKDILRSKAFKKAGLFVCGSDRLNMDRYTKYVI